MSNPFLDPLQFNQVKAFLGVLIRLNFNLAKVEPKFIADGMSLKKTDCLELLHKIPSLKGKSDEEVVKFLAEPANFKAFIHSKDFTEEQRLQLEGVVEEIETEEPGKGIAIEKDIPAQENLPVQTAMPAGGMGLPTPSISTPRIPVRQVKQTPPLGGMEGGTGQGNAATSKIEQQEINRVGTATAKLNTLNAPANTASSSTPPTETIKTPLSTGAETKSEFSSTRTTRQPGGLRQRISNLGRNGLNNIRPALGQAFDSGLKNLDRLNNLGRNGPRNRFRDRFKKFGKSSAKKSRVLIWVTAIFAFMVFTGAFFGGIPPGSVPSGQAAPVGSPATNPNPDLSTNPGRSVPGLDYTLPLKNTAVQPVDIRTQIKAAFPKAKLEYWDQILQSSQAAGVNPALALALWIEETHASESTVIRNGGSGIPNSEGNMALGHLGCAPTQDQTIGESLSCLSKFVTTYKFTNDQFAQFMAVYSSGPPENPFANNPYFPGNVKKWYVQLVPSGVGALTEITPAPPTTPAPQQAFVTSCPIPSGKITCGSNKGVPGVVAACHCTASYSPSCPAESRRGKAIDIAGPNGSKDGDPVYLPSIKGRALKWYFKGDFDDAEGATLRVFQSEPTVDGVWTIHFIHSKRRTDLLKTKGDITAIPVFSPNQEITDLTQPVAYIDKSSGSIGIPIHTHVSIGLLGDVDWQAGNLQYLSTGWKYADANMSMCLTQ